MSNDNRQSTSIPTGALSMSLMVLAIVFLVAGLAASLTILAIAYSRDQLGPKIIVWMVLVFAAACFVALILWILAYLCKREHLRREIDLRLLSAVEHLVQQGDLGGQGSKAPETPSLSVKAMQTALLEQLEELNINILLPEDQRRSKWKHLVEKRLENLSRQFDQAISRAEITLAEDILERIIKVAPDLPEISSYTQRIEKTRQEIRSRDISSAQRQIENLMAAGNFAEAQSIVNALLEKYPSDTDVKAIYERIVREQEAFAAEQRQRMYREVERYATARQWRKALEAAKKFIQTYPNTTEADAIRAQLSTLTENAKIEEAREMRDKIRDLINRRRFKEALVLAHEVIDGFPDTAVAKDLLQQLPRLEELARAEEHK